MAYEQRVKDIAYTLDPECWISYSGQSPKYKAWMDGRRAIALKQAQESYDEKTHSETEEDVFDKEAALKIMELAAETKMSHYFLSTYGKMQMALDALLKHYNITKIEGGSSHE